MAASIASSAPKTTAGSMMEATNPSWTGASSSSSGFAAPASLAGFTAASPSLAASARLSTARGCPMGGADGGGGPVSGSGRGRGRGAGGEGARGRGRGRGRGRARGLRGGQGGGAAVEAPVATTDWSVGACEVGRTGEAGGLHGPDSASDSSQHLCVCIADGLRGLGPCARKPLLKRLRRNQESDGSAK